MMNKRASRHSDEDRHQSYSDRIRARKLVIKMVLLKKLFKRVRYEFAYLTDFIMENLLLSITFVICVLLAIKDSAVPFFPNTPGWLMTIFEAPATPGIATIIDGLAYSYMASVIFFYVVNFLPDIKKRINARNILSPVVKSMQGYLSEILSRLEFVKDKQGVLEYGKINFNCPIYNVVKFYNGGSETKEYIDLENDIAKYSKLIIDDCERLNNLHVMNDVDYEIKEILARLATSETLHYTLTSKVLVCSPGAFSGIFDDIDEAVTLLNNAKQVLEKYYGCESYTIREMSAEERDAFQKE